MLLSVVIPAYNCEKTITRAIESTGVFSNNNIEVIIVNNGSTDKTEEVVKKVAPKSKNIKYTESLKGVSNARNKGIKLASAKWITFLDADDYLLNIEGQQNLLLSESFCDLLIYNYQVNSTKINLFSRTKKNSQEEIISQMLENPTKYLTVWGKVYKLDLIREKGLKFNVNLTLSEDSEFLIRYLLQSSHIKFCNSYIYNYCLTKNSTVRKYNPNMIQEYENAIKQIREDLLPYSGLQKSYLIFVLMQFNLMMVHSVFASPNNHIKKLKDTCNKIYMREALEVVRVKDLFVPRLLPLVFCKYHLYLFAALIYKLRVVQNSKR